MTDSLSSSLEPGTVIDGRYSVRALLGHGGMGHVYEAQDLRLGRIVAVKVVRDANDDGRTGERLFREARAAARADHAAVVTAYGFGVDPELAIDYFVMERLHGETVQQRIARIGPLPFPLLHRIALDAADALIAVHEAGVIHRDLKPSNVFLATRGRRFDEVKLLDFGVAKQFDVHTLTTTGHVCGTPTYMAPEQLSDPKRVDARCDLYSLGAVLFECSTGKPPQAAPNALAAALEIVYGTEPELRRDDIPVAFAEIVQLCMKKSRDARFADARALYLALEAVDARPSKRD